MKLLGMIGVLLLMPACATKPKVLPYVPLGQDIPRLCMVQCGAGNLVTGFVMKGRNLICECDGAIPEPPKPLQRAKRTKKPKTKKK